MMVWTACMECILNFLSFLETFATFKLLRCRHEFVVLFFTLVSYLVSWRCSFLNENKSWLSIIAILPSIPLYIHSYICTSICVYAQLRRVKDTEFHLVGFENSQTPSTTTVWPTDHREDYRSCAWPFYRLVRTFPKTLHSNKAVGTIWRALS